MYAALVEDFKSPPRYRETPPPVPNQGEVLLKVRAAALSNLVRGQANGSHYSSGTTLPFTPGNDGVGDHDEQVGCQLEAAGRKEEGPDERHEDDRGLVWRHRRWRGQ